MLLCRYARFRTIDNFQTMYDTANKYGREPRNYGFTVDCYMRHLAARSDITSRFDQKMLT